MTWKNYAAKYSGAALGFIADDFRGAAAGYYIGDYLTRTSPNMVKVNKRKRGGSTWKRRVKARIGPMKKRRFNNKKRRGRKTGFKRTSVSMSGNIKGGRGNAGCWNLSTGTKKPLRDGPNVYTETFQFLADCQSGGQTGTLLIESGRLDQWFIGKGTNNGSTNFETSVGYIALQMDQASGLQSSDITSPTANIVWPSSTEPLTGFVTHCSTYLDCEISNFTNIAIEIQLNIHVASANTATSVLAKANSLFAIRAPDQTLITQKAQSTPVASGQSVIGHTNIGYETMNNYGTNYEDCKGLSKFWRKLGARKITLAAGASIKFPICIKRNKRIDLAQLYNARAEGMEYLSGESIQMTGLSVGSPVIDITNGNNYVTPGYHQYGLIVRRRETFKFNNKKDIHTNLVVSSLRSGASLANLKVVGYNDAAISEAVAV